MPPSVLHARHRQRRHARPAGWPARPLVIGHSVLSWQASKTLRPYLKQSERVGSLVLFEGFLGGTREQCRWITTLSK
jgi:hypothetical protein